MGGYGSVSGCISMWMCEWMDVLFGVESEYTVCIVCAYIMYVEAHAMVWYELES